MTEQHNSKLRNKALALSISALLLFIFLKFNKLQLINEIVIILVASISIVFGILYLFKKHYQDKELFLKWYHQFMDFFFLLNMALIVVQVFFMLAFYPAVIDQRDGQSMEPTLHASDKLIVQPLAKVKNGEIVIIKLKNTASSSLDKHLVKRIVAGPNDSFHFTFDGEFYLNDKLITEEYLLDENGDPYPFTKTDRFTMEEVRFQNGDLLCTSSGVCKIPEDYYFVMGDNRSNSLDSRYFGLVHKSEILGVVKYRKTGFLAWEELN